MEGVFSTQRFPERQTEQHIFCVKQNRALLGAQFHTGEDYAVNDGKADPLDFECIGAARFYGGHDTIFELGDL